MTVLAQRASSRRAIPIEGWKTREHTLACGAAVLHLRSFNRKLGPVELVETDGRARPVSMPPYVASTYLPIRHTCPSSCSFKGNGCYATSGFTKFQIDRIEKAADDWKLSADDVIGCEADLLERTPALVGRKLIAGRDLRLHISGDVTTARQAEVLGAAAASWRRDGGGSVWTYTHAWRDVDRAAWGPAISVLASIESADEADAALRQGYAPAIVVDEFPGEKAFRLDGSSLRWVPCPAETSKGATCVECRLCVDRDLVALGVGIAFAMHGPGIGHRDVKPEKRRLTVVREEVSVGRIRLVDEHFACGPLSIRLSRAACAGRHLEERAKKRRTASTETAQSRWNSIRERAAVGVHNSPCVDCPIGAAHARGETHPDAPRAQPPARETAHARRSVDPELLKQSRRGDGKRPVCSACGLECPPRRPRSGPGRPPHDDDEGNTGANWLRPWGHRCPHGEPCPGDGKIGSLISTCPKCKALAPARAAGDVAVLTPRDPADKLLAETRELADETAAAIADAQAALDAGDDQVDPDEPLAVQAIQWEERARRERERRKTSSPPAEGLGDTSTPPAAAVDDTSRGAGAAADDASPKASACRGDSSPAPIDITAPEPKVTREELEADAALEAELRAAGVPDYDDELDEDEPHEEEDDMPPPRDLEHRGKKQSIADWAREVGISPTAIRLRLDRGWSVADAIDTPKGAERGTRAEKPSAKPPASPKKKKTARKPNGASRKTGGGLAGAYDRAAALHDEEPDGDARVTIVTVLESLGYEARFLTNTPKGYLLLVKTEEG